jgi:hypothetical protein
MRASVADAAGQLSYNNDVILSKAKDLRLTFIFVLALRRRSSLPWFVERSERFI